VLDQALVGDVLQRSRQGGADFAELYVERSSRRSLRVLSGEVKEATSGLEYGAGLRLFYGTEVVYAYTNDLSPAGLLEVADTLESAKKPIVNHQELSAITESRRPASENPSAFR